MILAQTTLYNLFFMEGLKQLLYSLQWTYLRDNQLAVMLLQKVFLICNSDVFKIFFYIFDILSIFAKISIDAKANL